MLYVRKAMDAALVCRKNSNFFYLNYERLLDFCIVVDELTIEIYERKPSGKLCSIK